MCGLNGEIRYANAFIFILTSSLHVLSRIRDNMSNAEDFIIPKLRQIIYKTDSYRQYLRDNSHLSPQSRLSISSSFFHMGSTGEDGLPRLSSAFWIALRFISESA